MNFCGRNTASSHLEILHVAIVLKDGLGVPKGDHAILHTTCYDARGGVEVAPVQRGELGR